MSFAFVCHIVCLQLQRWESKNINVNSCEYNSCFYSDFMLLLYFTLAYEIVLIQININLNQNDTLDVIVLERLGCSQNMECGWMIWSDLIIVNTNVQN